MPSATNDPPDAPGNLVIHLGAAQLTGYSASWREALDELSTAEFRIDLSDADDEPVDYLAEMEIRIDGEKAWDGTVVKALPRGARVHVHCIRGVSMTETQLGVMASEQCTVMDLAYALARSAGFSEDKIVISEIDKLPLETIEIVVALHGLTVPARRRMGPVTLVPAQVGKKALEAFDVGGLPEDLRDAFEDADCFAVVIKTTTRLWDAERSALADVDAVLGWLAVRARFGLAHLEDGQPQRYEREVTRVLPHRGDAMAVKGLGSGRRWIRDPATLIDRPTLELDDAHGQLAPSLAHELKPLDRLALMAARRSFDGDSVHRVVAFWEAWEHYAGAISIPKPFEKDELRRLRDDLPDWLNPLQRDRLNDLIGLANDYPLKKRLKAALDQDGVPMSESEFAKLWKLRNPRNRSVHGKAARVIDDDELEFGCSLLCRALVFRLGEKIEGAVRQ
jgi:hypothetical protein